MSWVTIIWSMIASACLTLAAMYLLVWVKKRNAWANLFISLTAASTAVYAGCELWMMRAETPGQISTALRWLHVPTWAIIVTLVGFVRLHMRAGRPWLAWTVCTVRTFALMLNFLVGQNLNYREVTHLRHIPLFGESVSVAEGVLNPWTLVGQLSLLLFVLFVTDATITVWRRGDRRLALVTGGSIVFFAVAGLVVAVLVLWEIVHWPLTASWFFMAIVLSMAYEMSRDTFRAAQLSDELSKKEEWLDLAADSAGVGLWLWDFKTNVMWATERARLLYGFSPNEPLSFDIFLSRLHPDDRGWVARAFQRCMQEGNVFRNDYRVVLSDGSIRWIRALAKALFMSSGAPERMTGVSFDITESKHMALELQKKRNELSHVARVSTMGQLASTLAHELNQPLGAILRNAEAANLLLKESSPDLEEVREILSDICKDDQRAGEVIDRMRSLLKRGKVDNDLLDLNLSAGEVMTLMHPEADARKVRLVFEPDPSVPLVRGDRVQLQQVLLNLLINAMDAMNDSASDGRKITVRLQTEGMQVEVVVSDTGQGIPSDKLDQVFEPFYSSKTNGLGMGLAISRGIIEAHGGRLRAQNSGGGGAAFTITLPAAMEGAK